MSRKKIHLAWFGAAGSHEWKTSSTYPFYKHGASDLYLDVAKMCERAKFDFVLFADVSAIPDDYGGSTDWYVRTGQLIHHDPLPAIAMMAAVTKNLGIASTMSTSFYPPFMLARLAATLDHLSGGRMAWNVVTSAVGGENFGIKLPEHDLRYEIAEEYIDLCRKLWASWEPDAVLLDRKNMNFADPSKVKPINFVGKYYQSRGPLNVDPSPQGKPVIISAGISPRGQRFAVENAEIVICHKDNIADMRKYVDSIRRQLVEVGRDPHSIKIFFSIKPVVGPTDKIARELDQHRIETADMEDGLAYLSQVLAYDLSKYELDEPLPADLEPRGIISRHLQIKSTPHVTLRELALAEARTETFPMCGSYERVAEMIEDTVEATGCDGFHFRSMLHDYAYLTDVATHLVPVLQEKGLFRSEYSGSTLRENLFG
jgi:FMN-dependent oxidoreductase (nitrilotriacetate monooxygenase family)